MSDERAIERELTGNAALLFAREAGMEEAARSALFYAGVGDLIRFARLVRAGWAPADESVQMDASPKFGTKRAAALALYKPPFKFQHGYIFDADGRMVADQDGVDGKVTEHVLARVRGWGYIQHKDKPELRAEELQDEVGAVMAEALTAYWRAAMAKGD